MNQVLIIAKKDVREALRSKSTYFYLLFLFFIVLPYLDGARSTIGHLIAQKTTSTEIVPAIKLFLNNVVHTLPMVLTMLFCSFLSTYSIIMDKTKRTLESLLATPASLKQIWLGKSLAVAVPSIAITFLVSLLALLAINLVVIVPAVGIIIWPDALSLITGLLIVPVMAFFVVCIVSFLQLIMTNPRIANFAFIVIFLGIYLTTITELASFWDFSLIYLGTTVVLAIITLFLGHWLNKDRVVLSSKG